MHKNFQKFNSLYEKERKKIDRRLKRLLAKRQPLSLYKPGSYILDSPGKRLRPLLVLFSVKSVGGKLSQAYNAAAAVELLHNFTLVHDDIMDNADKRRGRATLHKKYDTNTAILTGDSLLSVAYENLLKDVSDNKRSNGNCKAVVTSFTKSLVEVCEGQSLDKEFETRKYVPIAEYKLMIKKKTAAMMEMCCNIGAYIGNGSKEEINSLTRFGRNLGIAFQMQDDLLDVIGDESKLGKSVGSDIVEGKKTYLFLKAFEKAKGDDKKKLNKLIINKGISRSQVSEYQQIYRKLGVIEDAQREVKSYTDKALNSLGVLKRKEDREFFTWLADLLISRNK